MSKPQTLKELQLAREQAIRLKQSAERQINELDQSISQIKRSYAFENGDIFEFLSGDSEPVGIVKLYNYDSWNGEKDRYIFTGLHGNYANSYASGLMTYEEVVDYLRKYKGVKIGKIGLVE